MKRLEKLRDELADKTVNPFGFDTSLREGSRAIMEREREYFLKGFDAATKELMRMIEIQKAALDSPSCDCDRGAVIGHLCVQCQHREAAEKLLKEIY